MKKIFALCKGYLLHTCVHHIFQVKCMTFYDIVLDFILMDAFDDLENPPSSVIAVIQNRWLSNSFKETVSIHAFSSQEG